MFSLFDDFTCKNTKLSLTKISFYINLILFYVNFGNIYRFLCNANKEERGYRTITCGCHSVTALPPLCMVVGWIVVRQPLFVAAFQMLISMVFEWQFWKNAVFHPYPSHSVGILFANFIHTLLVCEQLGKGERKT